MAIQFFAKKPEEPGENWVQRFTGDEGFGCIANCNFDNDVFNINGPGMVLQVISTWAFNYRPSKMRVSYTASGAEWGVNISLSTNGGPNNIYQGSGLPEGTQILEVELDFSANFDIYRLNMDAGFGSGFISNIEFLEE